MLVRRRSFGSKAFAKRFQRDVESDLVAIPEAIDDCLGGLEDRDLDALDEMPFHAFLAGLPNRTKRIGGYSTLGPRLGRVDTCLIDRTIRRRQSGNNASGFTSPIDA